MKTQFFYTSSPPGSGKTKSLINVTENLSMNGENVLYVAPTKMLCEQFYNALKNCYYTKPVIITGNSSKKPIKDIIDEIYKNPEIEKTIIITTQALMELIKNNNLPHKKSFNLFLDESIDIFKTFSVKSTITSQLLFDNFESNKNIKNKDKKFIEITTKKNTLSKRFINKILKNPQDDPLAKEYYPMISEINNDNYYTYMLKKDFDSAIKGEKISTTVYSYCKPCIFEGFKTVTFLRANFEKSITYKIFKNEGIHFNINKNINDNLIYTDYPKLPNTVIKYVTDVDYSKNLRDKGINEEEILKTIVLDDIGQKNKFLITTNLDSHKFIKKVIKEFELQGEFITPKSDGRNDLMEHDKVVFLAVMNPKIEHSKGLENIGLNLTDLKRDMYIEAVIQFIWRGKIRIDPTAPYTIYVPDKRAAEAIKETTHVKRIEKIKTNVNEQRLNTGRKKIFDDVKIRNKISNTRQKIYKVLEDNDYSFTYFLDKYSKTGNNTIKHNWNNFYEEFYLLFEQNKTKNKNENILFSPSIFKESENSFRGMENHQYSSFIVLDFDKTKIKPEMLKEIDVLKNINMIHYSTYTKNNFRTIIDIDSKIPSMAYKAITKYIIDEIENIFGEKSGIDRASINPTQLYYIPTNNEKYSFCIKTGTEHLNIKQILKKKELSKIFLELIEDELEFEEICNMKIDTMKLDDSFAVSAMNKFISIPKHKKHHSLIGLVCGIKKANYTYEMAENYILSNEYCFKHRKNVETVLRKVYKR